MKTLHLLSTTLCLIVLFSFSASAQLNENMQPRMVDSLKHSIGAHAGLTTGVGLSYRFRPNRLGIQTTFGPLKTETETIINAGVSFIYVIFTQNDLNFFLYQGNSFRFSDKKDDRVFNQVTNSYENVRVKESYFNHGFGFGTEIIGYDRLGVNLMVGYGTFQNFELINVTGEVGIYIYL